MKFNTNRTLGGVGAVLMAVGVLPYFSYFNIVECAGVILVLVSLYGFAKFYRESGIFNNAIYGAITWIVGEVLAGAVAIAVILPNIKDFLLKLFPSWNGDWLNLAMLSGMIPNTSNIGFADILPFITAVILAVAVLWVFAIIAAFFVNRSLQKLSAKTNVGLFSTAGWLLMAGAVLVIALGLGLVLIWIGVILLAVAFFRIKQEQAPPPPTQ